MASLTRRLLRTKPAEQIVAEGGHGEGGELRRTMTLWQLPLLGAGVTLGTGVLVILGLAGVTWPAFGIWTAAGLLACFLHGHRHSRLGRGAR